MNTTVRLKIKKEVDTPTARKILKLKGSLIAGSFTDIIHFDDADESNYIHYFTVSFSQKEAAIAIIDTIIANEGLEGIVSKI
ncbi:hypothetical protein HYN59_14915 [Flavobacterium album]|uniref:Uncharacterized protein n=1 Tax=Flavobacterium album TaxID=2175091 RepID=A0A2S1R0W9_9FLAO|nr:hypothetical protein [Flavobacterium album]AWH86318.1 hypothetical protein HYN59_14915 [Flavobacterium album]